MEIALIISLIALAVALPGCIADSLTVIEKLRSRKNENSSLLLPDSLKKVIRSGLDHAHRLLFLKKASLFHLQKSFAVSCFTILAITLFTLVIPPNKVIAPSEQKITIRRISPEELPASSIILLDENIIWLDVCQKKKVPSPSKQSRSRWRNRSILFTSSDI